jgi:hypothetical protein
MASMMFHIKNDPEQAVPKIDPWCLVQPDSQEPTKTLERKHAQGRWHVPLPTKVIP